MSIGLLLKEVVILKSIRQKLYVYVGITAFGCLLLVFMITGSLTRMEMGLVPVMLIAVFDIVWSGVSFREYKRLKDAQLIIENRILNICPVISDQNDRRVSGIPAENLEVFISCFGILFDSRIIKFSQEGIRLKSVDIGRDFITLTYGDDRQIRSTRLLRPEIDSSEMIGIVEKFRYETGIIPTIIA